MVFNPRGGVRGYSEQPQLLLHAEIITLGPCVSIPLFDAVQRDPKRRSHAILVYTTACLVFLRLLFSTFLFRLHHRSLYTK